ncbi:MAG: hypothetical protein LBD98_05140 [Endomicrobium sp.]|nr:hypothetical protein [Endomicrobium sp.]
MKKLVLLAAMLCLVSECWADPVHRSRLGDACAPETEQQTQTGNKGCIIRADDPQVNQMVADILIDLQWRQQEQRTEPQIQPILLEPGFSFSD